MIKNPMIVFVSALGAALIGHGACGQASPEPFPLTLHEVDIDSGVLDNPTDEPVVAYATLVSQPGAVWLGLVLDFPATQLPDGCQLYLSSWVAEGEQTLDALDLRNWNYRSAFFIGDTVLLQVVVAPYVSGARVRVERLIAGAPSGYISESCASGFVPSSTGPVGHLFPYNASAFIAANGALVSRGTMNAGSSIPAARYSVVQFNVPTVLPDGTPRPADPSDQYPIRRVASSQWIDAGSGASVHAIGPNADGAHAAEQQGFLRMSSDLPPGFMEVVRVTGHFGTDAQTSHLKQRTQAGLLWSWSDASGSSIIGLLHYQVPYSSGDRTSIGGPVFNEFSGAAIGVHVGNDCGLSYGFSVRDAAPDGSELWRFIQAFHEPCNPEYWGEDCQFDDVHVDHGSLSMQSPTGTFDRSFTTVSEAAAVVPLDARLVIVAGNYQETVTFGTPMTIIAPVGLVRIGP